MQVNFNEERLKQSFLGSLCNLSLSKNNDSYTCSVSPDSFDGEFVLCFLLHNTFSLMDIKSIFFNMPEFLEFSKCIVEKAPFFSEYEIICDGQNLGTVYEVINKKTTTLKDLDYLYHGTSSYYASIIMKEGLKPRSHTNVSASFMATKEEGNSDCIYFSTQARHAVKRAAAGSVEKSGGKSTLLRVKIENIDMSKLKCCDKLTNTNLSIEDSLPISKNLRYFGVISPEHIINEGTILFTSKNFQAMQYYASREKAADSSKENNDPNRARTDPSMQGK